MPCEGGELTDRLRFQRVKGVVCSKLWRLRSRGQELLSNDSQGREQSSDASDTKERTTMQC